MNNRERLNAMSNFELVRLMVNPCEVCPFEKDCVHGEGCVEGLTQWLEQEVET